MSFRLTDDNTRECKSSAFNELVSSRKIAKDTNRSHSIITRLIDELYERKAINQPLESRYRHWQNKRVFKEYWVSCDDSVEVALEIIRKNEPREKITKKKISKKVRQAVMQRDGYQCQVCRDTDDLCLDHIIPESKGGTKDINNLQVLCRSCNSKKGIKTMVEWLGVKQ